MNLVKCSNYCWSVNEAWTAQYLLLLPLINAPPVCEHLKNDTAAILTPGTCYLHDVRHSPQILVWAEKVGPLVHCGKLTLAQNKMHKALASSGKLTCTTTPNHTVYLFFCFQTITSAVAVVKGKGSSEFSNNTKKYSTILYDSLNI